jgi:hypothetical protein
MNMMAFDSLPKGSQAPGGSREEQFIGMRESGFAGVQFADRPSDEEMVICGSLGLGVAGSGRVNTPAEARELAQESAALGYECMTLHVGWGLEDDDQSFRLIESILEASERTGVPLYVETHRATIFQDMWRTVNFTRRYPQLRFNGDLSHWYAGQEMVYGSFEKKFAYIKPILQRIRFIHGRIASPGCIQVDAEEGTPHLIHFMQLWTACFREFLAQASASDFICFTPELLSPDIYYAHSFNGAEQSDRWKESLLLNQIARRCFAQAETDLLEENV